MTGQEDAPKSPGESRGDPAPVAAGADIIIPALAAGLALYFIVTTMDLTREARITGWMIGFVLLGLCALQVGLMAIRLGRGAITLRLGEIVANTGHNRQRLALMLLLVLYVATIRWVGTTPGLFLTILGGLWIMGVRRPMQLFGIAGITAATVFAVFILSLGSRLPRGPLENILMLLLTGEGG